MDRAETFTESGLSLTPTNSKQANGTVQLAGYDTRAKSKIVDPGETITISFTFDLSYSTQVSIGHNPDAGEDVQDVFVGGDNVGSGTGTYSISGYSGDTQIDVEVYLSSAYDNSQNTEVTCAPDGAPTGSCIGTWPMQEDVAEWDIMPIQMSPDGGSGTVYAVDADTHERLTAALTDPGDLSGISNSMNVGFEVVFERTATDQTPALDAIFRRRKVT